VLRAGRIVVAFAVALAAAGPACADAPVAGVLKRLQERYDSTKTLRADFRQRVESPTLAEPLESRGRVAFEKPNRMRWDYEPPDKQTIIGDGETLWIYQPDQQQVIKAPLAQAFEATTPITFLAGLGRVDRDFDATLEREEASRWILKLVPKKDAGIGDLRLTVRKADASVEEARITDPLGTTTRITFSAEKRNVAIEPSVFRFTPPVGVDVVKPPAY
jgi:outer membrane lipoprotein carrier protein